MGMMSAVLDHDCVLYILTLGVVQQHRHKGVAARLVTAACQQAWETR
jgi:N-acetylglutamate synthase-like GNAT family acetyltransferase